VQRGGGEDREEDGYGDDGPRLLLRRAAGVETAQE
jgi:hypothetical protein